MKKYPIHNHLLFLDIETVPEQKSFFDQSEVKRKEWIKKAKGMNLVLEGDSQERIADSYNERGGIYAEFSKVVAISIGYFERHEENQTFRLMGLVDKNEHVLLQQFVELILSRFNQQKIVFCAHNGKGFDYPFLSKRLLINKIPLPPCLDFKALKPWEIKHLDTMELWKNGDMRSFTSLALLAEVFGLPTSKDDIDGSEVREVYYNQNDLSRLSKYCSKDVVLTAQVFQALNLYPVLTSKDVVFIEF